MSRRNEGFCAAILLVLLALLLGACAGGQATQNLVINEYLLTDAGFKKLDVNETTPKRQALMDAVPRGQFLAYWVSGAKWYVYADQMAHTLYLGDEAAYRKYQSLTNDRRVCQSLDAAEGSPFWSCFQEMQGGGKK